MIKIKIKNPMIGKNSRSFLGFVLLKDMLRDYSIEITDSDDYDYMFLGAHDILNKGISLQDSIEYGLENCNKITGDYFIFDGSDSTSLMASYEILDQSDAMFLFKNQLLKNREDYKIPTSFNKWFFKDGSDLDLGYDISDENWKKIKLSGWNLGYTEVMNKLFRPTTQKWHPICTDKTIDLCAIFKAEHPPSEDHFAENGSYYTNHRKGAWGVIGNDPGYSFVKDELPFIEYINTLYRCKMSLSPFGMGEIRNGDFEAFEFGVVMIKPTMNIVNTNPNPYISNETYIPVDLDWKNLNEIVNKMLDNPNKLSYIIDNSRKVYDELYSAHNFCMYWYDFFTNLSGVENE